MTLAKNTVTTETDPAKNTKDDSHGDLQTMLNEADALMHDVRKLIVKSDEALTSVGVKDDMEIIERWVESYRRGLSAANKINTTGAEIIQKLQARLKLAADEILRLEGEGGNTEVDSEQQRHLEQLNKASSRFEKLIPQIEQIFCACPVSETTKQ
jgi:hypothetical protein